MQAFFPQGLLMAMLNGLSEGGKTPSLMGILYFVKQKQLVGRCRLELSSLLCCMNQLEQGWTLNFDNTHHSGE